MKHSLKIVLLLLGMFLFTQILGLVISNVYFAHNDNIPYGMTPPQDIDPTTSLISIVFAIGIAVVIILLLMKLRTEILLRLWFFAVIILALAITINVAFINTGLASVYLDFSFFAMKASSFAALVLALPLAFIKVFKSNVWVHNLTELLIYPGIAVIFIPLLNVWAAVLLLILISGYDMYAVWHAGFMQKMAKYQIQTLKVFSGFFVPYLGKKERELVKNARKSSNAKMKMKMKKIKVNVAILGGGDVVFPIILAGVVLRALGLIPALMVSLGATFALAYLFYRSEKGKFYPAMPFITTGCLIALGLVWLLW